MDAIFLDTNVIRNADAKTFFGEAKKYQRIAELAQIYIPSIVMEEIKHQKQQKLQSALDSFKVNYFTSHLGCEVTPLKQHIEDKVEELYQGAAEEIDHTELSLQKDLGHMDIVKELALKKSPPFENKDDKGFKDTYIYLIILQYLEKNPKDDVFLITKDGRLREAFNSHERVVTLYNPGEYFANREGYFKEDYFVDKLKAEFDDATITTKRVGDVDITEDGDWRILVDVVDPDGVEFLGEIENEDGSKSVGAVPTIKTHEVLVDFATREIISSERV